MVQLIKSPSNTSGNWHQAGAGHYLKQCFHNLLTHICVTWPQWINIKWLAIVLVYTGMFCINSHECGEFYSIKNHIIYNDSHPVKAFNINRFVCSQLWPHISFVAWFLSVKDESVTLLIANCFFTETTAGKKTLHITQIQNMLSCFWLVVV